MSKNMSHITRTALKLALTLLTLSVSVMLFYAWYNRDTTLYAKGYSDSAFGAITIGMSEARVYEILNQPLYAQEHNHPETWYYTDGVRKVTWRELFTGADRSLKEGIEYITFSKQGLVDRVQGGSLSEIQPGMTRAQTIDLLGKPLKETPRTAKVLHYSSPSDTGVYHAKVVSIDDDGLVSGVTTYEIHD